VAFFQEIRHYFSIFFGFMPEFLVALNVSFTSLIEEGLVVRQVSCTLLMVGVLLIIIIIIIIINNNNK